MEEIKEPQKVVQLGGCVVLAHAMQQDFGAEYKIYGIEIMSPSCAPDNDCPYKPAESVYFDGRGIDALYEFLGALIARREASKKKESV